MRTNEYQAGDKVYYTGDMANQPGIGIITKRKEPDRFAPVSYDIRFDDSREFKGVYHLSFTSGSGRRFWLYSEWRADQTAKQDEFMSRMKSQVVMSRH